MNRTRTEQVAEPPLQPPRIPSGWSVRWNNFFEVEPGSKSWDDNRRYFDEDMLLLENQVQGVAVDLGWYPSSRASGSFMVVAVRQSGDRYPYDHPLRRIR